MTTLDVYNARARDYAEMSADLDPAGLDAFIAALPRGAAVLDLGCGPGHHAARMAAAGLDVTAVDASAEMCRLAAGAGAFTVREACFDDIPSLGRFDGIWASFSLLHAPRAEFPRHLADLKAALRPGGLMVLGMKLGEGEETDDIGRFYSYYSEAELRDHLSAAGFTPSRARFGSDTGLSGREDPWIVIDAHG